MPSGGKRIAAGLLGRRSLIAAAVAAPVLHYCAKGAGTQSVPEPKAEFATVAAMLADRKLNYRTLTTGDRVRAGGFDYDIAPANGHDHQLATAAGLRLAVVASTIRPEQFGLNGMGDELDGLQAMFDFAAGRGPIHISRTHHIAPNERRQRLSVGSNTRIVFERDGRIENLPHDLPGYEMLELRNVRNVEIVNAVLDGRRDLNRSKNGEWGNGIQIIGSVENIRIRNPTTLNMWGDGIYVGEEIGASRNPISVEIWNHRAENCRRQGMSITSAHRCIVHNPVWIGTNGTLPSAGLDIEPNGKDCVLDDIRIINPTTRNNDGPGILVFLDPLRHTTPNVNILISDHNSEGDQHGAQFARPGLAGSQVAGNIHYANASIRDSRFAGIMIDDWDVRGAAITIDRPVIRNPNTSNATPEYSRAAITIHNGHDGDASTIGNVIVKNSIIIADDGHLGMDRYLFIQNEKVPNAVDRVAIINPIEWKGASANWVEGKVRWEDPAGVSTQAYADTSRKRLIGKWEFAGRYSNRGSKGVVTFALSEQETPVGWPDVVIAAEGQHAVHVDPGSHNSFSPGGALGGILEIPSGGHIRLRRISARKWSIVSSNRQYRFMT